MPANNDINDGMVDAALSSFSASSRRPTDRNRAKQALENFPEYAAQMRSRMQGKSGEGAPRLQNNSRPGSADYERTQQFQSDLDTKVYKSMLGNDEGDVAKSAPAAKSGKSSGGRKMQEVADSDGSDTDSRPPNRSKSGMTDSGPHSRTQAPQEKKDGPSLLPLGLPVAGLLGYKMYRAMVDKQRAAKGLPPITDEEVAQASPKPLDGEVLPPESKSRAVATRPQREGPTIDGDVVPEGGDATLSLPPGQRRLRSSLDDAIDASMANGEDVGELAPPQRQLPAPPDAPEAPRASGEVIPMRGPQQPYQYPQSEGYEPRTMPDVSYPGDKAAEGVARTVGRARAPRYPKFPGRG